MACVILPSETARLVYGYLVKENLNEIAMQFLESSPYLTDCCQIVKSGFQFNTKLMGKDLQELLQEYSVIHNLVNNKVSLLCKTSLLYKRIKLRCESLPEILELILFWKYKNTKSEENFEKNDKADKNSSNQMVSNSSEYLNSTDVTSVKINNINTLESSCYNDNSDANLIPNNESVPENFHSKLCCETYASNKEVESGRNSFRQSETNVFESELSKERTSIIPMHVSTERSELGRNYVGNDNRNSGSPKKLDGSTNVLTINSKSQSENVLVNEMAVDNLETQEDDCFESQIKIIGIEENNQNENHALGVYSKSLGEGDENVNLENSSVVFVGQEVGNVTIDQERNQIIVIPIDYYKAGGELQSRMEIDTNDKQDSVQDENVNQQKDEIIFEGVTAIASGGNQLYSEKAPTVDDNIMTEKDFLKNQHLMYNIEKELKKAEAKPPVPQPLQESNENVTLHPVQAPLIVVSQTIVPNKPARYRTILPKKKELVQVHPVVVVHPLLENNKDLTKTNSIAAEPKPKLKVHPRRKKKIQSQKSKIKETVNSETLNMPAIKPPNSSNKTNEEELQPQTVSPEEITKKVDSEKTNEEKENLEKAENKKTETPVFVTKRNSKRLSLSTPRRRSHIRALEFETPPKTNEERKKSKTSPKIKVEHGNVERKSVRNTLFKSPIPENIFKSPVVSKSSKKVASQSKSEDTMEPLNELSIPIATRSPNTKLSEAWESLTGVGCVIGEADALKTSPTKKMWDADLRGFIPENNQEAEQLEKKRIRKPEKNQKDNRKTVKKKVASTKKIKPPPVMVSPSKMSLTAKRNTYSINGNEEGSPIRSLLDDLKIVTPFKDIETIRPTEETPLTKLLRENINTIDIDLSMINTPSFPPTPSIVITPDLDDVSMTGANYYSPTKDCSKDKVLKITDYFRVETDKTNKKETKEMHEKVIDDLVTKAKEIIGLGKEGQEESNTLKSRPSGKILSMVKIQMLSQCNKKLCENIPINEENNFSNQTTLIGSLSEEAGGKHDLKEELEEKRKRTLKNIRVVKENLSQAKGRVAKRGRKRRKSGSASKSKSDVSAGEKLTSESDESLRKESGIFHSTPYADKKTPEPSNKVDSKILDDIRQEFPSFQNNSDRYPELTEKSRKKLHYVEHFLKLPEIVKFVKDYDENDPPRLFLKCSLRRFFQIFYKWLKHPHKREVNASSETKAVLKENLSIFDKINKGLNQRSKKFREQNVDVPDAMVGADATRNDAGNKAHLSDEDEREWKKKEGEKRKDEEAEDGLVSTLPLKKRKSTVQQVEIKNSAVPDKDDSKNCPENVSQTQNFLQDIDVDRFLSQIHGQENR